MIKKIHTSIIGILLLLFSGIQLIQAQTVYTFTTAGATGRIGPTQAQINIAYNATNLAGKVVATNGIQYWTVPNTGNYTISALGAQGGGASGGQGASIEGDFFLVQNQVLQILVGQQGITQSGQVNSVGGGGGTFVVRSPATSTGDILVIAGGGGGAPSNLYPTRHASAGTSGNNGHVDAGVSNPDGVGGINGNGGNKSVSGCSLDRGAGGGGFLTDGGSVCQSVGVANGGSSFLNGGQGGSITGTAGVIGSFGGGGAVWQTGFRGSGGGGGYSGGGAGQINSNTANHAGGGGGSYNAGTNQVNLSGVQTGDGLVIITQYPTSPNDAGVTNILSPVSDCDGSVQNVEVEITNLGTNQISGVEIHWTINNVVQSVFNYNSLLDTTNGTGPNSANVVIGSMTLVGNTTYDIVAWTEKPNNVTDIENSNDTSDVTIQGYSYPVVNLGNDTSICSNDVIVLDAGSGRDSVLWNTTATTQTIVATTAQTYSVDVWENGCIGNDAIVVGYYPTLPIVDLGNDTMICFGDSITLDATNVGATYLWNDNTTGATHIADTIGNYSVTVTDGNSCSVSDEINISLFSTPLISLSVVPRNTLCFGSPFEFRANSFTQGSTMYQWKINTVNSGVPTSNNKFSPDLMYGDSVNVDLITNVCNTTVVESNYIVMYLKPEPKLISGSAATDTVLENTSKNYLVPVVTGSTFTWSAVGGTIASPIGNAVAVQWGTAMDTAKILVEEKDAGNCRYTNVRKVFVMSIVGVKDENNLVGIGYAYPNPANTSVTIPVVIEGNWEIDLSLYDITGKKVKAIYNGEVSGNRNFTFDVEDLDNGMYFYKITTGDGYESVKKLNIAH